VLKLQRILWPTDFSEPSYAALETANELALHFSARLDLLHVVSPIPVVPGSAAPSGFHIPTVLREMEEEAGKILDSLLKEKVSEEIQSRAIVVVGSPAVEIVRIAEENKSDVIVIATHGLTGWRKLVFGSVAERVVRTASCWVLTISMPSEKAGKAGKEK